MNSQFKIKLLQSLAKSKANKGFTLIELLVVVIIIGVLAAIALPNLLGQVAKGRQAEAKDNLGSLNRGEQAYFSEKSVFVPITTATLGIKITGLYYTYSDQLSASGDITYASYVATAVTTYQNDIKNYASAVNQDNTGNFASIICESTATAASGGTVVPSTGSSTAAALSCGAYNTVN